MYITISSMTRVKLFIPKSNLVNLKSYGLEVLFRSIKSSNFGDIDIKYINPKNNYYQTIYFGCVNEMSQSKTYVFIESY